MLHDASLNVIVIFIKCYNYYYNAKCVKLIYIFMVISEKNHINVHHAIYDSHLSD